MAASRAGTVLAPVLLLLSGCVASGPSDEDPPNPSEALIRVEDGEGGYGTVAVTNQSGAVVGHVLSDAGFGLPDARVTVFGADHGGTANETGWFQIPNVPPGKRIVRAEHPDYRAAESELVVVAGRATKLTITLVPPVEGNAGSRPHLHDYWAGRTSVVVADAEQEWYRQTVHGPYGTVLKEAGKVVNSVYSTNCVEPIRQESLSTSATPLHFGDPGQLVWPGTARIQITIRWSATDYVGADTIGLAWRPANSTKFTWSPPIKNGQSYSIDVMPEMWDNAHQAFTLWRLYACLAGKGEGVQPTSASQINPGRAFIGRFHLHMELFGGRTITADPPHPKFWQNGSSLRIIEGHANTSCDLSCQQRLLGVGRADSSSPFVFTPKGDAIVPPGTKRILAWLNWSYGGPVNHRPLGLAISPANVPPHEKEELTKFRTLRAIERTNTGAVYEYTLQPNENDGFYQKFSNWAFLWGYEGEETEPTFVYGCGCTIHVGLAAIALST